MDLYVSTHNTPGIDNGITNLMYMLSDFISTHFGPEFFKSTHVNTQKEVKKLYADVRFKSLRNRQVVDELMTRPALSIGFDLPDFKGSDAFDKKGMFQFPGSRLHPELDRYPKIFNDKQNMTIRTYDTIQRIPFTVDMFVSTRQDQLALQSILLNSFRFDGHGYDLQGAKTSYFINDDILYLIRSILQPGKKSDDELIKYLEHFSHGDVYGKKLSEDRTQVCFQRQYRHLYFKFDDEPLMEDGEKRDQLFWSFKTSFRGFMDVYVPITQLFSVPSLIAEDLPEGKLKGTMMQRSRSDTNQIILHPFHVYEGFKTDYPSKEKEPEVWLKIFDRTFRTEVINDIFDLTKLIDPQFYQFLNTLSDVNLRKYMKIEMYELYHIIPEEHIDWHARFSFTLKGSDTNTIYTMRIFLDRFQLKLYEQTL